MGKTKLKILYLFLHNSQIRKATLEEIAQHLKISRSVLKNHIKNLKEEGHVQRIGAKNNGERVLVEKNNS